MSACAAELAGFYEAPLSAYLAAHGVAADGGWRAEAERRGLDLRPWKRARVMPRVRAAISLLKAFAPDSLLDVGSGRGSFVWPAHEELTTTQFTVAERPGGAAENLAKVAAGGLPRFSATTDDACRLSFRDGAFAWATALEILEHLVDPAAAARELARVCRDGAVVTVPRLPDDNPEHLRLFDAATLRALLTDAGFASVRIEAVDACWFATARPRRR